MKANQRNKTMNASVLPMKQICRHEHNACFRQFVSFVERQRSLIPAIGFVSFVQFVVKTKEHDSF